MCQGQCNCNHKSTDIKDIIEATNDLIRAAKHVVACWEKGDLAEAVTNLNMTAGWAEKTLEDNEGSIAINPAPVQDLDRIHELILDLYNSADNCGCESPLTVTDENIILALRQESARLKAAAVPNLIINVSGGVVQDITSDTPEAFKNVKIALVDYDCDGSDPYDDRIGISCDKDGSNLEPAYMAEMKVEQTSLDSTSIFGFLDGSSYGSEQCGLAVNVEYPCTNCKDINQDGENCVNEEKCLAWRLYNER